MPLNIHFRSTVVWLLQTIALSKHHEKILVGYGGVGEATCVWGEGGEVGKGGGKEKEGVAEEKGGGAREGSRERVVRSVVKLHSIAHTSHRQGVL